MKWLQQLVLVVTLFLIDPLLRETPSTGTDKENRSDRGDVPGWVMITVMTAIVVIALLVVFRDTVTEAVRKAFADVGGAG